MIKLVAFDLDGTLVDSVNLSRIGFFEASFEMGFDSKIYWPLYSKTSGLPFEERIKKTMPFIFPQKEKFKKIMIKAQLENISKVRPYDKVIEMLEGLNCNKAIITSRVWIMANKIIKEALGVKFDYILTPELTSQHKPNPEPIFYLAKKFNIYSKEIAIVGDSVYDIKCGQKAGAVTIGVVWGGSSRKDLLHYGPDYIVDYPIEILSIIKAIGKQIEG